MDKGADADIPGKKQIFEEVTSELPEGHDFRDRIYAHFPTYQLFGWLGTWAYGYNVERETLGTSTRLLLGVCDGEVREAYHIAGITGLNSRIVDDILDGDGCPGVEDREEFLDRYISSLEGRHPEVLSTGAEKAAFTAGRMLNQLLDSSTIDKLVDYLEELKKGVLEEDKSTKEGYSEFVELGGLVAVSTAVSLDVLDRFDLDRETKNLCFEIGTITQIADDRYDGDLPLGENEIEEVWQEKKRQVNTRLGRLGVFIHEYLFDAVCDLGDWINQYRFQSYQERRKGELDGDWF